MREPRARARAPALHSRGESLNELELQTHSWYMALTPPPPPPPPSAVARGTRSCSELAVGRQRQPPSLVRRQEPGRASAGMPPVHETPDRVPAGLHRPRVGTSAPALSGMK